VVAKWAEAHEKMRIAIRMDEDLEEHFLKQADAAGSAKG
jgi:hypothetical protein